jgi:hypothetical protein
MTSRPKARNNKTKVQQDREEKLQYQLEQYKKPYTTNFKPKERSEEVVIQEQEAATTIAPRIID